MENVLEKLIIEFAVERSIFLSVRENAHSLVLGPCGIPELTKLINPVPDDGRTYDRAWIRSTKGLEIACLRSKRSEENAEEFIYVGDQDMAVIARLKEGELTGTIHVINNKLKTAVLAMRKDDYALAAKDLFEHEFWFSAERAYDSVGTFLKHIFHQP